MLDFIKQSVHQYTDFNANDQRFSDGDSREEKIEMFLELEKGHDIDNCQWMEIRKKNPKKLWAVAITDNDDPHNPIIEHVEAKSQQEAIDTALEAHNLTEEEVDSSADYEVLAFEVKTEDIIK